MQHFTHVRNAVAFAAIFCLCGLHASANELVTFFSDPPAISSKSPGNGATGVEVSHSDFWINFDRGMYDGPGKIRLVHTATDSVIAITSPRGYNDGYTGHDFSFDGLLMQPSTTYHIEIDSNAYFDGAGNWFNGIYADSVWSFTTEAFEEDVPVIVDQNPLNSATSASVLLQDFHIEFDEVVRHDNGAFRIYRVQDDVLVSTIPVLARNSYYRSIYPGSGDPLEPSTTYRVEVDSGFIYDNFGNRFGGVYGDTWVFTTEEAESDAPVYYDSYPGDAEVDVGITLKSFRVQLDEQVSYIEGFAHLYNSVTGELVDSAAFDPYYPNSHWQYVYFDFDRLEPATQYHVEIDAGAFADVFGNLFAGIETDTVWSFTTEVAETDRPLATGFDPSPGELGIGLGGPEYGFLISFDEKVSAVSGEARLINVTTEDVISTTSIVSDGEYRNYLYFWFNDLLLSPVTTYYVEIDSGAFVDVFGNTFQGIYGDSIWYFTTQDAETDPPVVESSYPSFGESGILLHQTWFSLWFDETTTAVGGQARLVKSSTGDVVGTADVASNGGTGTNQELYIYHDLLEPATQYHIEIDDGAYQDLFGNAFPGFSDDTWKFTTKEADTIPPAISYLDPADDALNVSIVRLQNSFTLQFDKPVTLVSGEARLIETSTGEVISSTQLPDYYPQQQWQYINFQWDLMLEIGTDYHIEVDPGSYVDAFGNVFGGISDPDTWSFRTQDPESIPPVIAFNYPQNGETGISIGRAYSEFTIELDEVARAAGGQARLVDAVTDEVITTATIAPDENLTKYHYLYFDGVLLETLHTYYVEVDAGAFEDVFGNAFQGIAGNTTWSFTTGGTETDAPILTYVDPSDDRTGHPVVIEYGFSLGFNEIVTHGAGEVKIIKTSTGEVVANATPDQYYRYKSYQWFSFSGTVLEPFTEYHVEIDAGLFVDVFGNAFPGISDETTWNFTTGEGDTVPPVLDWSTPQNGAQDVSIAQFLSRSLDFQFDEAVTYVGGEVRLIDLATDEVVGTASPSGDNPNSRWQYAYFNNLTLAPNTTYYVEIDAGTYQDLFGNAFAGISGSETWTFTTEAPDETAPVLTQLSPANGSTGVSIAQLGDWFRITFDESVRDAGGQARLVESSSGTTITQTTLGAGDYFGDSKSIYFNFVLLEPLTTYHLEIDSGTFVDAFGNPFAGISGDEAWSFTTSDVETQEPQISYTSPGNGATNVSIAAAAEGFYIEFDEAVSYNTGSLRLVETSSGTTIGVGESYDDNRPKKWAHYYFPEVILAPATAYHIEMDQGLFVDVFGNELAAISDETGWSFTTQATETDAPVIEYLWPTNGESNVSIGRLRNGFSIQFDEVVTTNQGNVELVKTSTGETVATAYLGDGLTRYPYFYFDFEFLEPSTKYHFTIDSALYQDVFGNAFEGISDTTTWYFVTQDPDSDAPEVQDVWPFNGSNQVELGLSEVSIEFDEAVSYNGGEARLVKAATSEVVKTSGLNDFYPGQSYQWFYFPSGLLEPETEYYIEMDSGAYVDGFGNAFEGISAGSWSFTTQSAETDKPQLLYSYPYSNQTNVDLGLTYVSFEFDEQVHPADGEVRVVETATGDVVIRERTISSDYASRYHSVHLDSRQLLDPGTQYHIEMDTATFIDLFGNEFDGVYDESLSFTTKSAESDPPQVEWTQPRPGETGVSIGESYFSISFNEAVQLASGEIRLVETASGTVIGETSPYDYGQVERYFGFDFGNITLEPNTGYHIEIDSGLFVDVFDNAFVGISDETSWSFTTQATETDPPVITYKEPGNNESSVPISRNYFNVYFDEPVQGGSGEIRLINSTTDEVVKTTNASNWGSSRYQGFQFDQELLEASTTYHIEMDSGVFVDVFGNEFEGIHTDNTWAFSTEAADADSPVISETYPDNGAEGINVTRKYFNLEFDEAVLPQTGVISLVETGSGTVVSTTTPDQYGASSWQGFYFYDAPLLEAGTEYHIEMDPGSYADAFGNDFGGISDETLWSFTTQAEETTPPEIDYLFPNNIGDMPLNPDWFTIGFDEPVSATDLFARLVKTGTGDTIASAQIFDEGTYEYSYFYFDVVQLEMGTDYHILIDDGAFEDVFGNAFAGISDTETWSFTTEEAETVAPDLDWLYPQDNSVNVSVGRTDFYMYFDEKVVSAGGEARLIKTATGDVVKTTDMPDREGSSQYWDLIFDNTLLEANTAYHIEMDAGIVKDIFDNAFEGIADETTWSFTTEDVDAEAPSTRYLWPRTGSINESLGRKYFNISFDETVQPGTGNINLVETGTGTVVKTTTPLDYGNSDYQSFVFDDALLSANTTYHIEMDAGVYVDMFGNDFAGISDSETWTFTTVNAETDPPVGTPLFPRNNQVDVPVDITFFQVSFDEVVSASTGNVHLVETVSGDTIATATPSDLGVSRYQGFSFGTIALDSITAYHVLMEEGAYVDAFGNPSEALTDQSWKFQTEYTGGISLLSVDTFAPTISSTYPENGSDDVALEVVSFTAVFNEQVSVETGAINLVKSSTGEVIKTTTPTDFGDSKVQSFFFDDTPLESSTTYHIEVDAATYADLVANDFAGINDGSTWSFTTADFITPTVTRLSPVDDETNVSTSTNSFEITFDEDVEPGSGSIRLIESETGEVLATTTLPSVAADRSHTITFDGITLDALKTYYIVLESEAFADESGNAFDGISANEWSFTTEDDVVPTISDLDSENGAEDVSVTTLSFDITFSEPVTANDGTINLIETSTGNVVKTTTSGTSSGTSSFSIAFSGSNLSSATQYHIEIASGAYSDLFGNDFTGISDESVWSFTTADIEAPEIAALALENGSTDVAIDFNSFEITFDESVIIGSGDIKLVNATSDEVVKTLTPSSVSGTTYSFSFAEGDLENGTSYYIIIDEGAFADPSGNEFEGIANGAIWAFTTVEAGSEGGGSTKLDQTITFDALSVRTYGDAAFSLVASSSSDLEVTITSSNTDVATVSNGSIAIVGAGTTDITVSQEGDDTYNAAESVTHTLTVEKARLVINIADVSSTYGEDVPTFEFSFSGFVNGEDESVLDKIPRATFNGGSNPDAGTYDIYLLGGGDDNYSLSFVGGFYMVAKASATISIESLEHEADGTAKAPTVTTSPAGLSYTITYNGEAEAPTAAGEYEVVVTIDETNYVGQASATLRLSEGTQILSVAPEVSEIRLYPNPVTDFLKVDLTERGASLRIYTLEGRLILQKTIGTGGSVDLRNVPAGIYSLVIRGENENILHESKLIKR